MTTETTTEIEAPKGLPINRQMVEFGRKVMAEMGTQGSREWVTHLLNYLPTKPALLEATIPSIAGALATGENLGLSLAQKDYHIIVRNQKIKGPDGRETWQKAAAFQFGYGGLLKLARRGGRCTRIITQLAYDADQFSIAHHMDPPFVHIPSLATDRGELRGCYCVGMIDGEWSDVEWMAWPDIEAHARRYSDAVKKDQQTPWKDELGKLEMARKTLIMRWCKRAPMPDEFHFALEREYADNPIIDVTPQPAPKPSLATMLGARQIEDNPSPPAPTAADAPAREKVPSEVPGFGTLDRDAPFDGEVALAPQEG